MPIILSTTTPASPACQPPARIYFEAPDDALLARVTEKVAERIGRHLSYTFHDEAPGGVTPIILEDVGPSAQPVETTVVNYPHAAGVVPGSLLLKEYLSGRTLTDSGRGHLIDQDGRFAATVDYETGTIHQPQAIPDALTERGAQAWAGVDAQGLRDGVASAGSEPAAWQARAALAAPQPSPTPQADSQPAPVLDYPPLPRVGAIGYASVVDIEIYAKTLTIGPHLPGVRDIALWTTDQMRAFADATHALRTSRGQTLRLLTQKERDILGRRAEGMDGNEWDQWVQEKFAQVNGLKVQGGSYEWDWE